jgi:hypothetical protein
MTPQEQQLIESLFQRLSQSAAQAGPRDPQAEALIQQRVQSLPGADYYMAQTLLVQERALQQAEARLAGQQQGGFLPPVTAPGQQQFPYATAPPYAPQAYQQSGGGAGSFLASAGKIALGVGGGILVADAAMGLARDVFGGQGLDQDDRSQGSISQQDLDQRQDYGTQQDAYNQQDYGTQQDGYSQQDDYAQQDDYSQQDDFDSSDTSGGDFGSGQDW